LKSTIEPRIFAILLMGGFFFLGGIVSSTSKIDIRTFVTIPGGFTTITAAYCIHRGIYTKLSESLVFIFAHLLAFITAFTTGGFVSLAAGWLILGPLMMTTMIHHRAGLLSVYITILMTGYILYRQIIVGDLVDTTPPEMKYIFTIIHTTLLMAFSWSVHFFFSQSQINYQHEKRVAETKSQFLSNMSHELRTPLNGVYGAMQIIQNSENLSKIKHLSQIGMTSLQSLLKLIDAILDQSKLETKQLKLRLEPINLDNTISQVLEEFNILAEKKSLRLHWQGDIPLKHAIRLTDETRLMQILRNLLGNAIKFTQEGTVTFAVKESEQEILFTVKDQGIGIKKQHLKQIFNRFEQIDMSNTRAYGGAGLGLTISKELVDLFEGNIWAESKEGEGSSFHVRLPMQITGKNPSNRHTFYFNNFNHRSLLKNKMVLVVDDDDTNRFVISQLLQQLRADVTLCHDGQEAIDFVIQNKVDLVIMDNHMPNMSGIDAFKVIKNIKPELPIYIHSGDQMLETQQLYKEIGFDAIIAKPIQQEKLIAAIKETFKATT